MKRTVVVHAFALTMAACAADQDLGESEVASSDADEGVAIASDALPDGNSEKTCNGARSDFVTEKLVRSGSWGNWGCRDMCPDGTYVYRVDTNVQERQGGGDDQALGAIKLYCYNPILAGDIPNFPQTAVTSAVRTIGTWTNIPGSSPNASSPFVGASVQQESNQGGGDDTSSNNVRFTMRGQGSATVQADHTGYYLGGFGWVPFNWPNYGSWNATVSCGAGQAICGLRTQIELDQGGGDDTALNGLQISCCTLPSWL